MRYWLTEINQLLIGKKLNMEVKKVGVLSAEAAPRQIKVIAPGGKKMKIAFDGNRWGDFKEQLSVNGFPTENVKFIHGPSKMGFETDDTVIPDGDFSLFLLVQETKAGAMSRQEINAEIKKHITAHGDHAKAHFTVDGKNYTQVSSDKLSALLDSYEAPQTERAVVGETEEKVVPKKRVAREKAVALNEVMSIVKQHAEGGNRTTAILEEVSRLSMDEKFTLVISMLLSIQGKSVEKGEEVVVKPAEPVETPEQITARLKKEKEDKEEEDRKEAKRKEQEEEERKEKERQDEIKRKQKEEDEEDDTELATLSRQVKSSKRIGR